MNNKSKAIVAGVAGAALLAGTAGTFALWSDSTDVFGSPLSTGELVLGEAGIDWWDVSPAGPNNLTGWDAEAGTGYLVDDAILVPGDLLVGAASFGPEAVTLVGTNLQAAIEIDGFALTPATIQELAEAGLWIELEISTNTGVYGTADVFGGNVIITPEDAVNGFDLKVTFDWATNQDMAATDNGQNISIIDLDGGITITLQQTRG